MLMLTEMYMQAVSHTLQCSGPMLLKSNAVDMDRYKCRITSG